MIQRQITLLLLCLTALCRAGAPAPVDTSKYKDPIRLACVGDSITYGAGVKDREVNNYPAQLGRLLGEKWKVENFGVNGATLLRQGDKPWNKEKACDNALAFKPDVVVIQLGTNDSKPQNWDKHKDDFAADYKQLIAEFRKTNPDVRIYACLPVPAYPGRWGIRDEIIKHEIMPLIRDVAKDTKSDLIDLHAALSDQKDLFPDTVHPDAKGAGLIAAAVSQALAGQPAPEPAPAK